MSAFRLIITSFCCLLLLFSTEAIGQTPVPKKTKTTAVKNTMTQSVFYDAQSLYYALQGYSAFPVLIRSEQTTSVSTVSTGSSSTKTVTTHPVNGNQPVKNTGPDAGATPSATSTTSTLTNNIVKTTDHYEIVESSTGAVVVQDCTDYQSALLNFQFKAGTDDAERNALIQSILARNSEQALTDQKSTENLIKTVPFLSNIKFESNGNFSVITPPNTEGVPGPSSTVSSSLNFNTVLQGTTAFIIDRLNDEINDAFFIHLQDVLAKNPELKMLFPNTLASLNKIQIINYSQSLNLMKTAYETDIKNIMDNVSALGTLEKYQKLVNDHTPLTLLFAACNVISMAEKGCSSADILYRVDTASYIRLPALNGETNPNDYIASIRLAAAISNAFVDFKTGDAASGKLTWVSPLQLKPIYQDNQLFDLFMGLFSLHVQQLQFGGTKLSDVLDDPALKAKTEQAKYVLNSFTAAYTAISKDADAVNNAKSTTDKIEVYIDMSSQLVNLADKCFSLPVGNQKAAAIDQSIKKIKNEYIPWLSKLDSIAGRIENKEYSAAVFAAGDLLDSIITHKKADILAQIAIEQKKDKPDPVTIAQYKSDTTNLGKVQTFYLKYATFIAAVAEAKSSDDVKNAINAFALPVGSSRIKKEHTFSWGINSYVGLYRSWNQQFAKYNLPANETGITVPIGLALNFKLPGKAGSLSAFGGLVDIGAIFAYQVNNANKTVQSSINMGQILSPSVGLVYGLFMVGKYNIPVSIGGNYQWGPTLKSIDSNGNSVLNSYTSRYNVFIAVDIPIVNFHVSEK